MSNRSIDPPQTGRTTRARPQVLPPACTRAAPPGYRPSSPWRWDSCPGSQLPSPKASASWKPALPSIPNSRPCGTSQRGYANGPRRPRPSPTRSCRSASSISHSLIPRFRGTCRPARRWGYARCSQSDAPRARAAGQSERRAQDTVIDLASSTPCGPHVALSTGTRPALRALLGARDAKYENRHRYEPR